MGKLYTKPNIYTQSQIYIHKAKYIEQTEWNSKGNTRTGGWGWWSTWNCAKDWNFIIVTNMHKPEPIFENEMHKILWDFDIQIQDRIPDQVLLNMKKRTYHFVDFTLPADHRVKIKWKARQILGPRQRIEKAGEHEGNSDTNYSWSTWNSPEEPGWIEKVGEHGWIWDQRKNRTQTLLKSARIHRRV